MRLRRPRIEVEDALELGLDRGDVVPKGVAVEQVAFLAAAAGVADHAGGAAGQRDRTVTRKLEPAQPELAHQMADVQGVSRRVEPDVDPDRSFRQPRPQDVAVRRVVHEAARLEIRDEVHGRSCSRAPPVASEWDCSETDRDGSRIAAHGAVRSLQMAGPGAGQLSDGLIEPAGLRGETCGLPAR